MFADDTTIFTVSDNVDIIFKDVQDILDQVLSWCGFVALFGNKMVIMLSTQGITYVKSAKILIANLVQVKSGHQTNPLTQWRCESRATLPTICRL